MIRLTQGGGFDAVLLAASAEVNPAVIKHLDHPTLTRALETGAKRVRFALDVPTRDRLVPILKVMVQRRTP